MSYFINKREGLFKGDVIVIIFYNYHKNYVLLMYIQT
jgi:hypothetical protein